MIQKLIDVDTILQKKAKGDYKVKPKKKVINNAMTELILASRNKILKAKGQARLDVGFKEERRLELNTSFELEFLNSEEFSETEAAYINFKDYESRTALHASVVKGNEEAVKVLIYNRACLLIRDRKLNVYLL